MPPWIKLWPEKLFSAEFFMLSDRARSTLAIALPAIAHARERGEVLSADDLQRFTGIPMREQQKALDELSRRGFMTVGGGGVSAPLFDEMQRPIDATKAGRQARWRGKYSPSPETPVDASTERRVDASTGRRVDDRGDRQEEQKNRVSPQSPNGDLPPDGPRRLRPVAEPVEFDPVDEPRVRSIMHIEAQENKSGTLAISKVATIRATLRSLLDECGVEAWRYGLDEAIGRCKGSAYARAIVKASAKRLADGKSLTISQPAVGRQNADDDDAVAKHLRSVGVV